MAYDCKHWKQGVSLGISTGHVQPSLTGVSEMLKISGYVISPSTNRAAYAPIAESCSTGAIHCLFSMRGSKTLVVVVLHIAITPD